MSDQIKKALEQARKLKADIAVDQLSWFQPLPKQLAFFATGKFRERGIIAANRSGKSSGISVETACHLTGAYPDWWPETAKRFDHPVTILVSGKTGQTTRDLLQQNLLGPPGSAARLGTGMIPRDCVLVDTKVASHSAGSALDFIDIKHVSGGTSRLTFRTYKQGRDLFEGLTLDMVVFDEEPGEDVYSEALVRLATTRGICIAAFTPMEGRTPTVKRFLDEPSPDRTVVRITIDDDLPGALADPEEKKRYIASIPPHERGPRLYGEPSAGANAVFPVDLETLKQTYPPLHELPPHWYYLWGIDFGIGHPFAAVLVGYDRDADCVHVIKAIRVTGQTPLQHVHAMKQIAGNVRVAWPKDGHQREKSTGAALIQSYRDLELDVLTSHAVDADGGVGLEPVLQDMWLRMTSDRFRVNRELTSWFEEARDYHRDENGNVVPMDDDLLSATRYACMMVQKYGDQVVPGSGGSWRRRREIENMRFNTPAAIRARNDFDPWTGEAIHHPHVPLGRNMLPEVTLKGGKPDGPKQARDWDFDPFDV
jgi:phage terminase large subunit-like protein